MACFNLFGHDRDDHAKNFSFIMNHNAEWSFSPVYDVVFSYGVGSEHSTTYLGEGQNPTEQELLKLAQKHHIPKAKEIIEEVKEAVGSWQMIAKEVGVSQKSIKEVAKVLKKVEKSNYI